MRPVTEVQAAGGIISTIQSGVNAGRSALTEVDDDATQDFRCSAHQLWARPGSRPARLGGSAHLQVSRPPETSRTAARASPKLVSRASKVLRRIVIHFRESRPASIHAGLNGRDYPTRRLNFGDGPHDRQVATMDSSW